MATSIATPTPKDEFMKIASTIANFGSIHDINSGSARDSKLKKPGKSLGSAWKLGSAADLQPTTVTAGKRARYQLCFTFAEEYVSVCVYSMVENRMIRWKALELFVVSGRSNDFRLMELINFYSNRSNAGMQIVAQICW